MNSSLITVIIPVYNSEKYLHKCLNSILNQDYSNLQIIIVDDGSTDSSLKLCKTYNDERIEIYHKVNGGASSARNFGLEHRKGEYVLFVDSDDYLLENAIKLLVSTAIKYNADCVYYEADNVTENSKIKIKRNGLKHAIQYPVTDGDTLIELMLNYNNYHAVPFLYFAKSELYNKGLHFEEGIMFEDELFSFELLRMSKVVVPLKCILYYRNVRSDSVMTSSGKEMFRFHSICVVFEKLLKYYHNKDNVSTLYMSRISMLWLDYYNKLSKNDKQKEKYKYQKIIKNILRNNGFQSKELVIRCKSEWLWFLYIAPGKLIKRIKG